MSETCTPLFPTARPARVSTTQTIAYDTTTAISMSET